MDASGPRASRLDPARRDAAPPHPPGRTGLGRKGAAGAVVIAGGFSEVGPEGRRLQEELLQVARRSGIRLFGPNTFGFIHTRARLNASVSPDMGGSEPGGIGVVSQSGSVCETLYFRCQERGVGFSTLIAAGNEADLDLCDYLEYLLLDPDTTAIALYVEQIRRPRRFNQEMPRQCPSAISSGCCASEEPDWRVGAVRPAGHPAHPGHERLLTPSCKLIRNFDTKTTNANG